MEERGKFALQKGTFMDIICMLVVVITGKAACVMLHSDLRIFILDIDLILGKRHISDIVSELFIELS